jgi:hypothetical protein
VKRPEPHTDHEMWARPGLKIRYAPHRHYLWAHRRYGAAQIEHTSIVIVARNWFMEHVWPLPLVMLAWKYGWPRGRHSHWAIKWAQRVIPEGADYQWKMLILRGGK